MIRFSSLRSREAFTLIELIIYAAIFTVIALVFLNSLIFFVNMQAKQSAQAEVASQSQFLLQTVQRYVEQSSYIDMPTSTATGTLTLRMSSSSTDKIQIYASGNVAYMTTWATNGTSYTSSSTTPLTSSKVNVSSFSFTRIQNGGGGHDSVNVSFNVAYNASSSAWQFANSLKLAVARVNAATFDSGVYPSVGGGSSLGSTAYPWSPINNVLYFANNNVGVNVSPSSHDLEVNGDLRLDPMSSAPTCDTGTLYYSNASNTLQLCVSGAWKTVQAL